MEEFERVLEAMSTADLVGRRDRAIVAATCLFGTRANATASLLIGDVDVERRVVLQDATRARVKNSKSQVTRWFPVGASIERALTDWIDELRRLGCRDNDALFPPDADLRETLSRSDREPVQPWATEDGVRRAFRRGCYAAGIPYINPHAVRHALTAFGRDLFRTFAFVLREGSLSGAARALGMTQPSVARHIDALEAAVGGKLFIRSQRGLSPTDRGLALRTHAESLMATSAALLRAASGAEAVSGTVRVTASEVVGAEHLPPILADLRRAGVVISQRGQSGGWRMARPATEVSVADVIRAVDGPLVSVYGLRPESVSYNDSAEVLQHVWIAARSSLREVFEHVSIQALADGSLPDEVKARTLDEDAWAPH